MFEFEVDFIDDLFVLKHVGTGYYYNEGYSVTNSY